MEPALLQQLSPRKLVVFRALQLGDMLCAVPALRALRAGCPQARVTLVGLPWASDFAARFAGYVDDFVAFPGFPGLPEREVDVAALPGFLADLHARRFDLAVQMHGDGRLTNVVTMLFKAARTAGFRPPDTDATPDFLPYPTQGSEIERLLALAHFLGAPDLGSALEFPLLATDRKELAASGLTEGLTPGGYLCLPPGARAPDRRWPPECFAAAGDVLHAATGLPLVLTGSAAETGVTAAVQTALRTPARDAAAPIGVGALAALLSGARLVLSNDTGVAHLCAALRVPSVIVFRNSELARWAHQDRSLHRAVWAPAGAAPDEGLGEVLAQATDLLAGSMMAPAARNG